MRDDLGLILERDGELKAVTDATRAAAEGRGSLLLVTGPGGIGKTTLLRAARAGADDQARVLTACGMALEQDFSFGIARQLLEPVRAAAGTAGWDELLDGAARLARRVFDGGPAGGENDPHATIHGLYWLIANLAVRRPLLIVVDDAHWADAPSLRWLSHLATRIDDLPVALLLAARSGPDQPELIDELSHLTSCTVLAPRPLSAAASATVVRARLAPAPDDGPWPDDEFCAACHESTGGHPFLLQSLLAALVEARDAGTPLTAADVAATGPRPVAAAVARRVRQLGDGAAELTRAVAVLGGQVALRHAAALAGQDLPRAARLADGLRAAHVLAPGTPLEFAHPIVGTAVYDSMPPGERAIAHGKSAVLLEADGVDAERVAPHLLRSEPGGDPGVVTALRAAAGAASDRGAPDLAACYLRRALAEPPDAAARPGVLLSLGTALASVRDPEAVGVLMDAVAQAPPGKVAEAAVRSAGLLGVWGHHDSALRICRDALDALGAPDPPEEPGGGTRDKLEAALFAESWLNAETSGQAWDAVRAHRAGEDGEGGVAWRVYEALSATITGAGRATALACLDRADLGAEPGVPDTPVSVMALLVLLWNDELPGALRACDAVLADARRRGSLNMVADVTFLRSAVLTRMGKLAEAAEDGRYSLEFKLSTSPPLSVAWAAAAVIDALVGSGSLGEADEVAGVTADRRPPEGWIQTTTFTQSRGALRVAQHRYEDGLRDLLDAAEGWRALGVTNPAVASWRAAAVTAYAATGREQEAARLAAEQVTLARAAGGRLSLGVALRVSAPFADDPVGRMEEALSHLRRVNAPVELARAQADLGARLRRAGRRAPAQRQLRAAMETAERCGARSLGGYARRELLATGARPRRAAQTGPDALTGAERQVATLAAEGLSNRQIAQHLFVTRATVETHLRHAFHKLGISSRTDLPDDLGG